MKKGMREGRAREVRGPGREGAEEPKQVRKGGSGGMREAPSQGLSKASWLPEVPLWLWPTPCLLWGRGPWLRTLLPLT